MKRKHVASKLLELVGEEEQDDGQVSAVECLAAHLVSCDARQCLSSALPLVPLLPAASSHELLPALVRSGATLGLLHSLSQLISFPRALQSMPASHLRAQLLDPQLRPEVLAAALAHLNDPQLLDLAERACESGSLEVATLALKRYSGSLSGSTVGLLGAALRSPDGELRPLVSLFDGEAQTEALCSALYEPETLNWQMVQEFGRCVGSTVCIAAAATVMEQSARLGVREPMLAALQFVAVIEPLVEPFSYAEWEVGMLRRVAGMGRDSLLDAYTKMLPRENAARVRCHLSSLDAANISGQAYVKECQRRIDDLGETLSMDSTGVAREVDQMVDEFKTNGGIIPDSLVRKATLASGWYREIFLGSLLRPSPRAAEYFEDFDGMEARDQMIHALSRNNFKVVRLKKRQLVQYRAACISMGVQVNRELLEAPQMDTRIKRAFLDLRNCIEGGDAEGEVRAVNALLELQSEVCETRELAHFYVHEWIRTCSHCAGRVEDARRWADRMAEVIERKPVMTEVMLNSVRIYFTGKAAKLTHTHVWTLVSVLARFDRAEMLCHLELDSVTRIVCAVKAWLLFIKASMQFFKVSVPQPLLKQLHFCYMRMLFLQRRGLSEEVGPGVKIVADFKESAAGQLLFGELDPSVSDWLQFELTTPFPVDGAGTERARFFRESLYHMWAKEMRPATVPGLLLLALVGALAKVPDSVLALDDGALGAFVLVTHQALASANQALSLGRTLVTMEKALSSQPVNVKRVDALLSIMLPLTVSIAVERAELELLHQFLARYCDAYGVWVSSPMLVDVILDVCRNASNSEDVRWLLDTSEILRLAIAYHWPRHRFDTHQTLCVIFDRLQLPPAQFLLQMRSDEEAQCAGQLLFLRCLRVGDYAVPIVQCRLRFWQSMLSCCVRYLECDSRVLTFGHLGSVEGVTRLAQAILSAFPAAWEVPSPGTFFQLLSEAMPPEIVEVAANMRVLVLQDAQSPMQLQVESGQAMRRLIARHGRPKNEMLRELDKTL